MAQRYDRRFKYRRDPIECIADNKIASAVVALLVVVFIVIPVTINYHTFQQRTVVICGKERAAPSGEYRIYTSDGTFVMEDIFFAGRRFDTADAYGKLKEDKPYRG